MDYFAGMDVSVKETSICIVDGTGKIVREVKVADAGPVRYATESRERAHALRDECVEWLPRILVGILRL